MFRFNMNVSLNVSLNARFLVMGACLIGGATPTLAQITTPEIAYRGERPPQLTPTAVEAMVDWGRQNERATDAAVPQVTAMRYPKDSLRVLEERHAQEWVTILQHAPIRGIQIDPYGVMSVAAHHESVAEEQINARLASHDLSLADRAYTLQMAVAAFSSSDYPTRLPIAERYLTQLDALGKEAAFWQFGARQPLIYTYYRLGKRDDIIRIGTGAFDRVSQIPFDERGEVMYYPGISLSYAAVVDAMSGRPNGRQRIHAMNVTLAAATAAPPELVAHDSTFVWISKYYSEIMQGQIELSERVGEPGTPLIANYWVNRGTSRDSQSVAVNDGKVRIVEIGSFTCAPCMAAVAGMERLHQKYPGVEVNFMTAGMGIWGNRIVPPHVEAEHLADHFVKTLGATFPIGIAMASGHVTTIDDGNAAVITTPTWHAGNYPQTGKPTFYVIDGHGVIRRVFAGYNRDLEENLATIVEYLQKESVTASAAM